MKKEMTKEETVREEAAERNAVPGGRSGQALLGLVLAAFAMVLTITIAAPSASAQHALDAGVAQKTSLNVNVGLILEETAPGYYGFFYFNEELNIEREFAVVGVANNDKDCTLIVGSWSAPNEYLYLAPGEVATTAETGWSSFDFWIWLC